MEPEHNVTNSDIEPILAFFDSNVDKNVTLKQLIEVAKIKITLNTGHKQIHIGFTNNEAEMQIMWVSTPQSYNKPIVQYGRLPGSLHMQQAGTYTSYNVGHLGFHGRIYRVVLKNL